MLGRIREPFGRAGLIVAVVALVAALVGGAYAAGGGLSGKQKKQVKKIAKQFAGEDGAPGPAGQTGPQGPKGDTGATGAAGGNGKDGEDGKDGKDGTDGKNGESVTIVSLEPGNGEGCDETGGAKFANGAGVAFACNGKDGSTGSGENIAGLWEVLGESGVNLPGAEWAITTISFPVMLATAPSEAVLIQEGSSEEDKAKCPGDAENPKATAGVLCLYITFSNGPLSLEASGLKAFGAGLLFAKTNEAFGTWAVAGS